MELERAIENVIRSQPGLSAREIAAELRKSYDDQIHKRDLNPTLYRRKDMFIHDGGDVPRWRLVGQRTARSETNESTQDLRAIIRRLDQHRVIPPPPQAMREVSTEPLSYVDKAQGLGEGTTPDHWVLALMPWQQSAMEAWYRAGRVGTIEAVTGTGKTHLGLEAVAQCVLSGQRATVLVPSLELMRQWRRRIAEFLPNVSVGLLGGGLRDTLTRAEVVVANVNSAIREDLTAGMNPPVLLVADEVHRYGSPTWRLALRGRYRYRMGLTATLERSADDGIEAVVEPFFSASPAYVYTYARAVPEHVVAPFDLIFLGIQLTREELNDYEKLTDDIRRASSSLRALGVSNDDFNRKVQHLSGTSGRVGFYARLYQDSARKRRNLLADCEGKRAAVSSLAQLIAARLGTAIFTQRVRLAEECAYDLRNLGVEALAVHGKVPPTERQDAIDRLADGSIAALVAPKILDEGIDIPNIDLGIVLGASRGRRQMIQRLGRVIRKKADGHSALFLVVYARGTVEDPEQGAHEGFIEIVREAARSEKIHPTWASDTLRDYT